MRTITGNHVFNSRNHNVFDELAVWVACLMGNGSIHGDEICANNDQIRLSVTVTGDTSCRNQKKSQCN